MRGLTQVKEAFPQQIGSMQTTTLPTTVRTAELDITSIMNMMVMMMVVVMMMKMMTGAMSSI